MCKVHKSELEHAQAFHKLIWDHLKIKLAAAEVAGMGFDTDGHASV